MSTGASHDQQVRLETLEALTDTSLRHLDVDDLLAELLSRVRDMLAADTAAVLLIDESTGKLVARAARGIEEEVRQGVEVPLGAGFAGRVAATRRPIRLDRVDSSTVANPILWQKGIQMMLGVPLLSDNTVLGVLHVGRLDARPFSDADVDLLERVAERVAAATTTRRMAIEQAAAALLERSLMPGALPRCPGLELAARYVTSESRSVGGDWYDLFTLPSGQLWIVVGDVAGHGLQAAVVMGRIRSALRAYTLLGEPPERVLELVDRKIEHFEIGAMATVICGVADPPYDVLSLTVAGHPPPVVAVPGRPNELMEVHTDLPLGTGFAPIRSRTEIALPSGAVVAFYTDGLVERRGTPLDVGLELLPRRGLHATPATGGTGNHAAARREPRPGGRHHPGPRAADRSW